MSDYFRATKDSTAGSPEFVIEFLDSLNRDLQVHVKDDFDLLQNVKVAHSKQVTFLNVLSLAVW